MPQATLPELNQAEQLDGWKGCLLIVAVWVVWFAIVALIVFVIRWFWLGVGLIGAIGAITAFLILSRLQLPIPGTRLTPEEAEIMKELELVERDPRDLPRIIALIRHALAIPSRNRNKWFNRWLGELMRGVLLEALATALVHNPQGDTAANIDEAIDIFNQFLASSSEEPSDPARVSALVNLGNAYEHRVRGDRAENIEEAIFACRQALAVVTQAAMPVEWAMTMNNLGNAYLARVEGDQARNIEAAISAYQQALTVRTQSAMPVQWAITMMNLGLAYSDRIEGDQAQNIGAAIFACRQALTVFTRDSVPVQWAMTMNNLGNAFLHSTKGNRAENIEEAIFAYRQALTVFTRDSVPVQWAMTMNNLGNAYRERFYWNRIDNVKDAISAYQQALTVRTRMAFPIDNRDTLRNLALLYFDEHRWSEALQTCLEAIEVGADVFDAGIADAGRIDSILKTWVLYINAAYSAVQMSRYGDALSHFEAGRARLLAEAQSLGDTNLTQLTDNERQLLQTLRERIKSLEYEYRLPMAQPSRRDDQTISRELGEARRALGNLIDTFRARYPDFLPEGLALVELLVLIPVGGALVAPLFTAQGSAVFIVPGGVREVTADHVLMLDGFTLADVHELTRGRSDAPDWGGWLGAYFTFKQNRNAKTLFDGIDDVTHRLWDAFVGRIYERLQLLGVSHVLFMPQGDTSLVPIHAAWREVNDAPRYFMDDYRITYMPSMRALANARRKTVQSSGALVVGVSDYKVMNSLPNTRAEAESIAKLFGETPLIDAAASVDVVRERAKGKTYLHLSCHGGFGWGSNLFDSALFLANDEALPLSQIMAQLDLASVDLVVLSACETGIVDFNNAPDEFVGLPAGFMQAGAAAVISSLWTVEDRSTALLMDRMYKLMLDKDHPLEPAEALRQAQFWLRDVTAKEIGEYYQAYLVPRMSQQYAANAYVDILRRAKPDEKPYAHPFYWAAFTYNGL